MATATTNSIDLLFAAGKAPKAGARNKPPKGLALGDAAVPVPAASQQLPVLDLRRPSGRSLAARSLATALEAPQGGTAGEKTSLAATVAPGAAFAQLLKPLLLAAVPAEQGAAEAEAPASVPGRGVSRPNVAQAEPKLAAGVPGPLASTQVSLEVTGASVAAPEVRTAAPRRVPGGASTESAKPINAPVGIVTMKGGQTPASATGTAGSRPQAQPGESPAVIGPPAQAAGRGPAVQASAASPLVSAAAQTTRSAPGAPTVAATVQSAGQPSVQGSVDVPQTGPGLVSAPASPGTPRAVPTTEPSPTPRVNARRAANEAEQAGAEISSRQASRQAGAEAVPPVRSAVQALAQTVARSAAQKAPQTDLSPDAPQSPGGTEILASSVPAVPTQPAPASPVAARPASPGEQIAEELSAEVGRGGREVTVRLHPPELGDVQVRVTHDVDGVRAVVEVRRTETFEQLQRESDVLTARLGDNGVPVKGVQFVLHESGSRAANDGSSSPWFDDRGGAQQQGERDGAGSAGEREAPGEPSGGDALAAAPAATVSVTSDSINVWM